MLLFKPESSCSKVESAVAEIKEHNSCYELARFTKIPLNTVRNLIGILPENAYVRFTNNYFESYAQIIYLNGLCYIVDLSELPSKDSIEEWTWGEDEDSSITNILNYLKDEELEIERNVCPDAELEDLMDYKWITGEWVVHIDSSYLHSLDEVFFSVKNPDHEDSDPELTSLPVYPKTEPAALDIPDIATKLYQAQKVKV